MFPIEIWEYILKKVDDPIELTRLRRVCMTWNAIVTRLLQHTDAWSVICKRDIDEMSMWLIWEQQNIPDLDFRDGSYRSKKLRPNVWAGLYRSWMSWRRLPVWGCNVKALAPFAEDTPPEFITGVAALSDTIAVCTSEGRSIIYNIAGEKIHTGNHHWSSINNVTLWRNYVGNVMVSTSTDPGVLNHFDLNNKTSEGINDGTRLLCSSFQRCYTLGYNAVTMYEPVPTGLEYLEYGLYDYTRQDAPNVVTMYATRDLLYVWDKNGLVSQDVPRRKTPLECMSVQYIDIPIPTISIRSYKIFAPNIFCCVGELGEFGFIATTPQWKIYDEFRKLFAPVTAVLFHIGVLALGLDTGEVYLYRIDDVDQLQNMDFQKMVPKKLCLDTMPIQSLNAVEHNSTYYLIASTKRQVHLVKFFTEI